MSTIYATTVSVVGGRSGVARSDDGNLDLRLSMPGADKPGTTNPEQLFAAGYAACFGNAVIHVTRRQAQRIRDDDVEVVASVAMSSNDSGGFQLSVKLDVTIAGVSQDVAEAAVADAHEACPYSNAVRGNIDVAITVRTR